MMRQGWSTSLSQPLQQWSTMLSWTWKMRFASQLSRMNCQTFAITLISGHFGGSGNRVMLIVTATGCERCQPA